MNPTVPALSLGFLTILTEGASYLGGYLVTNAWGRPLEFRLSSAVQPNKVQQILYGPTLGLYLGSDLIGKTLVEKTGTPATVIFTDCREAVDLRRTQSVPVLWVSSPGDPEAALLAASGLCVREGGPGRGAVLAHPDYPEDAATGLELFQRIGALDLAEPFSRIREAIGEARKMGVNQRAAS
ncbi:MAG: hypothetical protein K1X57_18535 [Gemmataceae bacterium]|nr:hypothetical protein [Gemmataceae bacterium]